MAGLPQLSIFQQLSEKNISWINYSNTSGFNPDSAFLHLVCLLRENRNERQTLCEILRRRRKRNTAAVQLHQSRVLQLHQSFHPPSPVTDGEMFIKKVYESLRASPQWNETFFIMVFDEHGGFADHVPPPTNVPAGDNLKYTEAAPDGKNVTFDFTRLGVRVPALVISPWVGKGVIEERDRTVAASIRILVSQRSLKSCGAADADAQGGMELDV
jgi:phospholipase C